MNPRALMWTLAFEASAINLSATFPDVTIVGDHERTRTDLYPARQAGVLPEYYVAVILLFLD